MAPNTDTGSLADSTFELINSTDGESQDGPTSESTGSLHSPQGDEVVSIPRSANHFDTESDDESGNDGSFYMEYTNEALQNPSVHFQPAKPAFGAVTDLIAPITQSIELKEEDSDKPVVMDKISAKHTIRELSDEESAEVARALGMTEAPKRVIATIRQTMSQAYLSTKEPLRLLYAGSPAGYRDIVHKVSQAICATRKVRGSEDDKLYNIVPISEFGSDQAPEVEVMGSSGYQIKVEICTHASECIYEGGSFPEDAVYTITIENASTYQSLFSPRNSSIQPKWDTPHIAIFYCTENDDWDIERTRDAAWAFMSRHGVPCIFISNSQSFVKPPTGRWRDSVDQNAVHMCLESRDPERPMRPQRLPVDLSSFSNIDARQMNRNLAYLTGLKETTADMSDDQATCGPSQVISLWSMSSLLKLVDDFERNRFRIVLVFPFITAILVSLLTAACPRAPQVQHVPASPSPISVATSTTARSITSTGVAPTATSTIIINITRTKTVDRTVEASKAPPTASSLASALSFAGFLSDKPTGVLVNPQIRKTICTVEVYSPTEILVRLPSGRKTYWLAKGAIDIDVLRGEEHIKKKLSVTDEGIVVELKKKDAHGTLSVSVLTTRKPKVNETFEINLGRPAIIDASLQMMQEFSKKFTWRAGSTRLVEQFLNPAIEQVHRLRRSSAALAAHVQEASKAKQDQCFTSLGNIRNSVQPKILHVMKDRLSQPLQAVEQLRQGSRLALIQAQISSKLWWLKVLGKSEEYAEYQRNAACFLKGKHFELLQTRRAKLREMAQDEPACQGKSKMYRVKSKGPRWMKKMMG